MGICISFIGRDRVRPSGFGTPSLAVNSVGGLGDMVGKKGNRE